MSKQNAKRLRWTIWNAVFVTVAVLGVAFHVEMAANVFKFLAWLTAPLFIVVGLSNKARAELRKEGPSVSPHLTCAVDMSLACLLAAYGWFGYAALIGAAGLLGPGVYLGDADPENTANN